MSKSNSPQVLELHIHTNEHSACSEIDAAQAVARCVGLGYDGMVITNHFCNGGYFNSSYPKRGSSWKQRIDRFMHGYYAACEAAPDGFAVFLGMELRFCDENDNDYLVLGLDEDFLHKHKDFDQLGIAKFSKFARKHGLFITQVHPFRFGMTVTQPKYVDAIEVYNGHAGHESHNEMAQAWCDMHGLIALSGSDYHGGNTGHGMPLGGIILQKPVHNGKELIQEIRSGNFMLMK